MSFPRNSSDLFSGGLLIGAALGLPVLLGLSSCSSQQGPDSPGIVLGAPGTSWAAKTLEQRFGYMAAQVHPVMTKVFVDYDPDKAGFDCSNCHGSNMEQIDYEMPNKALYALPKERPYDDAIDYDAQIAVFMMTKVTPTLQELFNKGEGPPTKASCFSCHPMAE